MILPADKRRTTDLPKRILFLNDVCFQYGAGIAQARQVECMLSLGIEVGALAWAPGSVELEDVATHPIDRDLWLGIREVNHLVGDRSMSDDAVIAGLLLEVARFEPTIIIVGNLHAARWPFKLFPALRKVGCRVLTFLHDAYLYTGRCAYPGSCELYLTGCNETCPTATEYPALAPHLISDAWKIRREIFGGPDGVEVISNSHWNRQMFKTAIPNYRSVETIHLGADEFVFKPGDKSAAREQLGLPSDKPIILCAAVNFQEQRKGCRQLQEIIATLKDKFTFAAFGHNTDAIPGLTGLGYHLQAHKLATIYQAADLFLGTATEEAFGQTIMEAQLCGLPVVAFNAGGVSEIVRNEITGKLVNNGDTHAAITAIESIMADTRFLPVASAWARQYAVSRFSRWAHESRWHIYLAGRVESGTGHNPASIVYPLSASEEKMLGIDKQRPSWPGHGDFVNDEHKEIYNTTSELPGWQAPGDSLKLYEMGYHAGDVILEIGPFGGRSSTVALRGALANPERTERPRYYGIDIDADSIARTRATLATEFLGDYCHLYHGVLQDFIKDWKITPTMVFLDGDHTYEGVSTDLKSLSTYLKPGTPLLMHDFMNTENATGKYGVRKAAEEWEQAGHGRFMGCCGCCALYTVLEAT